MPNPPSRTPSDPKTSLFYRICFTAPVFITVRHSEQSKQMVLQKKNLMIVGVTITLCYRVRRSRTEREA